MLGLAGNKMWFAALGHLTPHPGWNEFHAVGKSMQKFINRCAWKQGLWRLNSTAPGEWMLT